MAKVREKTAGQPKRKAQKETESLQEMIEKRAYELFEKRGREHGRDLDDWLEAERMIKQTKKQ
ncbi:MAG: DUF2934 domain-containing protein [Candidatus Dadabacteria bacterium]|nr:DUF2934 domain-containing protein [Candidatus Dadabacteria bacterium]